MQPVSTLFPQLPSLKQIEHLSLSELIDRANYANEFKNWREAYLLFELAEKKCGGLDGHVLYRLGSIYKHGHTVTKDEQRTKEYFSKAHELLLKKAEKGDPNAQCDLAIMYECGDGVPQDFELAVYWYQLAVEKSLDEALCNLGYMHSSGNGIPKNTLLAVKYIRKPQNKDTLEHYIISGICTAMEMECQRIKEKLVDCIN